MTMSDEVRNIVNINGRDRRPWAVITRERLLRASIEEIALRGYDHARLVDIAARADLTVGAVYNWFDDKAELFSAAIEFALQERQAENLQYLSANRVSERAGLPGNHWLMMIAALAPRQGGDKGPTDTQRILLESLRMSWRDEDLQDQIQPLLSAIIDQYAQVIDLAKADGEIDEALDTRLLARVLVAIPVGLSSLTLAGQPDLDPKSFIALFLRLSDALKPRNH